MKPVDAVIVGFGWTGALMAAELCEAGLNVVALERGGHATTVPTWAYPKELDEIAQSARHGLLQDLGRSTVTMRHDKSQVAAPYRQMGSFKPGEGVGGAGVHWAAAHFRVLPEELKMRSHYTEKYGAKIIPPDMTLQDWGVTYEDLEPYLAKFEAVCGTSCSANNIKGQITGRGNHFEPPRSAEFPLPPQPDHVNAQLFRKATAELGYHPFPVPSDTISQPYRNI